MEFPNPVAALFLIYSCFLILLYSHHASTAAAAAAAESRSRVYIVHMDKSHMPMPFSTHHHWYSSLLLTSSSSSAKSLDLKTTWDSDTNVSPHPHHNNKPIYVYDHAFHGFSALLSPDELELLKASRGFLSAYPNTYVTLDTTRSVDFLSLTTASGLWPAANYGKDVIIGVIDSGIWPESPSFRDDGMGRIPARWKGICQAGEQFNSSMCNRKLIGARYFNQATRAADPNVTITMNSARDIDGHGTHVASIAAGNFVNGVSYFGYANGTARGVAPRAMLAVYKVWGDGADFLAAFDQAVADGVDILSISMGTGPENINLYENPLSIASFGAREKGVVVCFSAGNTGPGTRTIREKGIPWAIIVAGGTVDRWFAGTLTLGNGTSIPGRSLYPLTVSVENLPIVYNETLAVCDSSLAEFTQEDAIIVCNGSLEGASSFSSIMSYLPLSKARAAIFIADESDPIYLRSYLFTFPVTVISPIEGLQVTDYVSKNIAPRATIVFQETIIGQRPRTAPELGDFSSRGPARSYEGILKPDVMAPGALILAAYPPNLPIEDLRIGNTTFFTNYTLMWGTSMACPHIAGVAALLKAAHPDWSPSAIQSAIMTTANPLNNADQPIRELDDQRLVTPLGMGSGHVDPNRALNPGLVYDNTPQDFVNLVCALNFTREQTQTIIRSNYSCSTPSSDLNYPSFVATFQPPELDRTLTRRFQRTVTNVGSGAATYRVSVEAPANTTVRVRPKKLVFRNKYEKLTYVLSVRFVANLDEQHRPGTVTWTDATGKYIVRSPIMVSAGADFFE